LTRLEHWLPVDRNPVAGKKRNPFSDERTRQEVGRKSGKQLRIVAYQIIVVTVL
jgi:hypothetical protein